MINNLKYLRDKDMIDVYNQILKSGINVTMLTREKVARMVSSSEAPRFYITPKMAERYVYGYLRGENPVQSSTRQRMICNLVEVYHHIMRSGKYRTKVEVWNAVVRHPAKEFYAGHKTVINLIYTKIHQYERK